VLSHSYEFVDPRNWACGILGNELTEAGEQWFVAALSFSRGPNPYLPPLSLDGALNPLPGPAPRRADGRACAEIMAETGGQQRISLLFDRLWVLLHFPEQCPGVSQL